VRSRFEGGARPDFGAVELPAGYGIVAVGSATVGP